MKQNPTIYRQPYLGCLIGSAYQRMISRLDKALGEAGLGITPAEYLILRALYSHDGLQQCEIGDMVGKDKGAISRTVTVLAGKGMVRTEAISHKCTRVWIAEKGRDIECKVLEIAAKRHKALMDLVPQCDIDALERVLRKILEND